VVDFTVQNLLGGLISLGVSLALMYWVVRLALRHGLEEHEESRNERERRREEAVRVQEQRARIRAMEEGR
jgi:hypothetical protein